VPGVGEVLAAAILAAVQKIEKLGPTETPVQIPHHLARKKSRLRNRDGVL
jgi:hypothetical protein